MPQPAHGNPARRESHTASANRNSCTETHTPQPEHPTPARRIAGELLRAAPRTKITCGTLRTKPRAPNLHMETPRAENPHTRICTSESVFRRRAAKEPQISANKFLQKKKNPEANPGFLNHGSEQILNRFPEDNRGKPQELSVQASAASILCAASMASAWVTRIETSTSEVLTIRISVLTDAAA